MPSAPPSKRPWEPLSQAWDRTVRTKIMMQPLGVAGGCKGYDNDEKLEAKLLETTGCADVSQALAAVAQVTRGTAASGSRPTLTAPDLHWL